MLRSLHPPGAKSALPDSGELASAPLPRLFLALRARSFDGALTLQQGRQERRFVFRGGSAVLSESNLPSESLGAHLINEGRLTTEDRRPALHHAAEQSISEANALIDLEILDPLSLFHGLRGQIRRHLLDSMDWRGGRYEIVSDDGAETGFEALGCDLLPLAHQALMAHWNFEELLGSLAPNLVRFPRPEEGFLKAVQQLQLETQQAELLLTLEGNRPIDKALGRELTTPAILAALWVLEEMGVLGFADTPTPDQTRAENQDEPNFDAEIELTLLLEDEILEPDEIVLSPMDATAPGEGELLRKEIEKLGIALETSDHYQLLGVTPDAKSAAIKKAYIEAAKRYHPDALARLGLQEMKNEASDVFSHIAQAFEVLSNPATRKDYDAQQRGEFSNADAQVLSQAETAFRKGEVLLRMGDFKSALPYLDSAVEIWPEEGAYQSGLGWALYKKTPSDPESARERLERAIELTPQDPVAHFRLGMILRALGETEAANASLAQAKQLEPAPE